MKKKKHKKTLAYAIAGLLAIVAIIVGTFQYSRSWQNGLFLKPLHQLETTEKIIALTFDDGPSETRTPALLDLLDKHEVKATFFMVGENIEKYPSIAQEVYNRGHLIGNHSYNHPRLIFKGPSFMKDQITRTEQLIQATGQQDVQYFRPPYSSKYIVLPLVLQSMNKTLVTGTYDPPSEYADPYNAQKVADEVISNIQPGAIIYLHDGKNSDQEAFIESVELIILGLKNKGYSFVRIDDVDAQTEASTIKLGHNDIECYRLAQANIEPQLQSAETTWNKDLILSDITCQYHGTSQEYPYQVEAHGSIAEELPDYTSSLYQEIERKNLHFYGLYDLEYSEECLMIDEETVYSEVWKGGQESPQVTQGTARCRPLSQEEVIDVTS